MPPGAGAIAGAALEGAIRTNFLDTYKVRYRRVEETLRSMALLAVPSDKVQEKYVYFESVDHPQRQPRDDEISFGDYKPSSFIVVNHKWSRGVKIHEDDEEDDQTAGGLIRKAREIGGNFALIPERVFFQILLGTSDPKLLPAVPNAPDGVAFFSATDGGGGARFGATNGNLLAGSGVATAQDIRTDFWATHAQFLLFKDSKNDQPLILPEDAIQFDIWFNVANEELFREAFKNELIIRALTFSSTDLAAGVDNTLTAGGKSFIFNLHPTSRITDNDWYTRASFLDHYSLFEQSRTPIREVRGDMTNSDSARLTGYNYMAWKSRSGFGLGLPYDWIKTNN